MYSAFASEHSRKWSNGKLPLSGGRGGSPLGGSEAKDAIHSEGRRPFARGNAAARVFYQGDVRRHGASAS
jgi:hypothetical protein